ncbi:hypothetical protein CS0771_70890 [Catellatospora sp. IY07-71]|nr:hypothetical protein CS0771_70890 [Catellatospora sp. IY07-71]
MRELRFHLDGVPMRVTYWIAGDRRVILLTVFRKTRWRESREVARAQRALAACIAEAHTLDDEEVAR